MRLTFPFAHLPIRQDPALAYRLSLAVATLMAVASVAGLDGLYGPDSRLAIGVTEAGLPVLLGSMWLAQRGSLFALLLWPGTLLYALPGACSTWWERRLASCSCCTSRS